MATHPVLGLARETLQVLPGQRRTWNVTFETTKGTP
jgi:hypothetical protein